MTQEDVCAICLENVYKDSYKSLCCNNMFHFECLESWFRIKNTCPLCRGEYAYMENYNDKMEIYLKKIKDMNAKDIVNNIHENVIIYKEQCKELDLNFLTNIFGKAQDFLEVLQDFCDKEKIKQ